MISMKPEKCECSNKQTEGRVRSHWSHPTDTTLLSVLKKHKLSSCGSSEDRVATQRCICWKMIQDEGELCECGSSNSVFSLRLSFWNFNFEVREGKTCSYWISKAFFKGWHDMFSFWSRIRELMSRNLCEAAQLALDQRPLTAILTRSSAVDSAPHPTPLLHFVDLPPELLFAHRQNSSQAPEITITAHTHSRSTLSELLLGADQKFPSSSSSNLKTQIQTLGQSAETLTVWSKLHPRYPCCCSSLLPPP